jgi:GT2 family glycosyltransferase
MIAIIVPVYRRFNISTRLFECLNQIQNIEVIVVDDGCEESYRVYCSDHGFIYIEGSGKLYWGGMVNRGLEYVKQNGLEKYERIIFANDDVVIDLEAFNALLSLDLDIIHPVVLDEKRQSVESGAKLRSKYFLFTKHPFRNIYHDLIPKNKLELIDIFTGRFLVMKPRVIEHLGGIRTKHFLHYGGDSDFGLRSRGHFKAYIYSDAHIYLNTLTTSNSLKIDANIVSFTRSLFKFKSASNIRVKFKLIRLNFPYVSQPINFLILVPYAYVQFMYSKWKK